MTEYLTDYISLPADSFEVSVLIITATLKINFLLLSVFLTRRLFRTFSAATKHLLLMLSILAAFLIPVLSVVKNIQVKLPVLEISAFNRASARPVKVNPEINYKSSTEDFIQTKLSEYNSYQTEKVDFTEDKSTETNLSALAEVSKYSDPASALRQASEWLTGIWLTGAIIFLFRLLVGFVATKKLARKTVEVEESEWTELLAALSNEFNLKRKVSLRRSSRINTPIVCGFRNSIIILPLSAEEWSSGRRRVVLLHELSHVARRDCLIQFVAEVARCFYWYNPLVWYAVRRMRIEREQACDDKVLNVGTVPSDYAHHLFEIARSLAKERFPFDWSESSNVALARKSLIEKRLTAILDAHLNRLNLSPAAKGLLTMAALTVIFPLSALQLNSQTGNYLSETMPEAKQSDTNNSLNFNNSDSLYASFEKPYLSSAAFRKKAGENKRVYTVSKGKSVSELSGSVFKIDDSEKVNTDAENASSKFNSEDNTDDWETRSRKFRAETAAYWEKRNKEFAAFTESENQRRTKELRERQEKFDAYTESENRRRSKELQDRREKFDAYLEAENQRRNDESQERQERSASDPRPARPAHLPRPARLPRPPRRPSQDRQGRLTASTETES